jgi:hypothetical protein
MDTMKKERLRAALVNLIGYGVRGGSREKDMDEVVDAIVDVADIDGLRVEANRMRATVGDLGPVFAFVNDMQDHGGEVDLAGILLRHLRALVATRAAIVAEREGCVADLRTEIARYSGTSEGDIFARVVLDGALLAVRRGQAGRAGPCGKPMEECGGSCWLPVGHTPEPCACGGDTDGTGCPS